VLFYVINTNPLMWWKDIGAKYPRLVHLALKYLGIPVTSVPSEINCSLAKLSADDGQSETDIS